MIFSETKFWKVKCDFSISALLYSKNALLPNLKKNGVAIKKVDEVRKIRN